jgi:hypothetical protein
LAVCDIAAEVRGRAAVGRRSSGLAWGVAVARSSAVIMDLDEATVAAILEAQKTLAVVPVFEAKGAYYKARGEVQSQTGFELAVEVTWSSRTQKSSACLFVKRVKPLWSRIFGIDLGDDHHNPDCVMTGDPHRHNQWTVRHGSRFASPAPDLRGKGVSEMFSAFLRECKIDMIGTLAMPAVQRGLFP